MAKIAIFHLKFEMSDTSYDTEQNDSLKML